jgi:hypothetical protein
MHHTIYGGKFLTRIPYPTALNVVAAKITVILSKKCVGFVLDLRLAS